MTKQFDREIERLFINEIVPLGKRAKSEGTVMLETRWSKDAPSYFRPRSKTSMTRADFESGGCTSPETAVADLRRLWSNEVDSPLAALAPAFAKLATGLRDVQREADEVSSFIYVMY